MIKEPGAIGSLERSSLPVQSSVGLKWKSIESHGVVLKVLQCVRRVRKVDEFELFVPRAQPFKLIAPD